MDYDTVIDCRDTLLNSIGEVSDYNNIFRTMNRRWAGAITAGMIETARMKSEAAELFRPLIQDMRATKTKYEGIQQQLVDAILFEMTKKVIFEITDAARFTINILKRNLFERTADVGYLATDAEVISFLKTAQTGNNDNNLTERVESIRSRLIEYQYEYTVYDEIILLDIHGNVRATLGPNNTATMSQDPLLGDTQAISLNTNSDEDKFIETFRQTDLRPGNGDTLIYSQKIEDPDTKTSLGTLCLCFNLEDEMRRIFKDLNQGNPDIISAVLDADGRVLFSNCQDIISAGTKIPLDLDADFKFFSLDKKKYLIRTVATDGYQGFYGLTWYGMAMINIDSAFQNDENKRFLDAGIIKKLQNFSTHLSAIKMKSDELLSDMKIDSVNGEVQAAKFNAKSFIEVLHFVKKIGLEIDKLFSSATGNLQETVVTSLSNELQFRAFQGNNIADRNLYERANDVCWWALTPLFRRHLAKHESEGLSTEELQALTKNLQYINNLYTPYLRLVLVDTKGIIVAASNPPDELEEKFVQKDLPRGQEIVGMALDKSLVNTAMGLPSSKAYCVSDFEKTPLYGGRPTYLYSTAVRDHENDAHIVGSIQIVFDSEPQFSAMLMDTLPRDEKKEVIAGCFGILAARDKTIISSTSPQYTPGSKMLIEDRFFQHPNGARESNILEMEGQTYITGLQVSDGYREYKREDGYVNDLICLIFVPI